MNYPQTITDPRSGYTVTLVSRSHAIVSGGLLGDKPANVRTLLGKGDSNPKTKKNTVITKGLSLAPQKAAGIGNVCPHAVNCISSCIGVHSGKGSEENVKRARIAKTVVYYLARKWFIAKLRSELKRFRASYPADIVLGVRLNMFSDIPWEHFGIMEDFPGIMFYDYSKNPRRTGQVRPNYWVTFSYDGTNGEHARQVLAHGGNVSVVFYNPGDHRRCGKYAHQQTLPEEFMGADVIDGGETDWRPDDPKGVIVGLRLLARTYASRNRAIAEGFAQAC